MSKANAFNASAWPFTVKVPLLVMLLMLAISFVISNAVLDRLDETQERHLQTLSRAYLDGLGVNLSPHILREDVWEVFDILDRARSSSSTLARHTVVLNPANQVIAATHPRRFPTGQSLPPEMLKDVPLHGALVIDRDKAIARTISDVMLQGRKMGSIYTELDISQLLAERRAVLWQLIATNVILTLLLMAIGYWAVRRMVWPVRVLGDYLARGNEGTMAIIPGTLLSSADGEFGRLFRRYNAMASAANERVQLAEQLAEKERLASLGRLASGMAHDINNPLGGLFNALHALKRYGHRDAVRSSSIDLLERGLGGIRDVVRATLMTYRKPEERPTLTRNDIEDLRLLAQPALRQKELVLNWLNETSETLPLPGRGIRDSVLNLLLNACAASPPGRTIFFGACVEGQELVFGIRDEGSGLPAAYANFLERGDAASPPLRSGEGLGLWMVRRLLDETGGQAAVQAGPGGSEIILRFPLTGEGARHVA